ncbi:MAG: hypothetical protein HND48_27140 [Chloroflexi bacterium]|nr:hypothetical protein [Chloroflexota bacterium]
MTKLTKFGAFARLVDNNEIEGLIHIQRSVRQPCESPEGCRQ